MWIVVIVMAFMIFLSLFVCLSIKLQTNKVNQGTNSEFKTSDQSKRYSIEYYSEIDYEEIDDKGLEKGARLAEPEYLIMNDASHEYLTNDK